MYGFDFALKMVQAGRRARNTAWIPDVWMDFHPLTGELRLFHGEDSAPYVLSRRDLTNTWVIEVRLDEPNSPYGDLMTREEFQEAVGSGSLVDYDGHGSPSDGARYDSVYIVWPSEAGILPPGVTHILWFNR